MPNGLLHIFVFMLVGAGFVTVSMIAPLLLAPSKKSEVKLSPYECGEVIVGKPWVKFNVRYYIFALLFLIFDVEVAFMFPWAVILKELGLFGLIEMLVFILILVIGLVYPWKKGFLKWV